MRPFRIIRHIAFPIAVKDLLEIFEVHVLEKQHRKIGLFPFLFLKI